MRILGEFLAPWMMCIFLPSSQRSPYASSTILRDQWLLSLPPTKPPSNKISVPWTTRFGDEAMYFHPGSTSWILKGKDIVDDLPAEISSEYFHMPSGLLIPTFLAQHSLPPPLPATISSSRFCTKTTHRASDGAKLHSMMMGNAGI